jgi:hypothetical protein
MAATQAHSTTQQQKQIGDTYNGEYDPNLVALWLQADPIRWVSGAVAGILAGAIGLAFAMLLGVLGGMELWFPAKLMASILIGAHATDFGFNLPTILLGIVFVEVVTAFLGIIYAHFTATNSLNALVPMGLVWGIFSWIFIWSLFMRSFQTILAADIPSGAAFPVCVVFGLSLASVSFIDRALRGNRKTVMYPAGH